ncbi:hypothetical protein J4734_17175 [Klebsiella pneumoniae]|uniref:Uncharacterized protein n=1 Tax=Klebsiella pneumoniae TaxID=573 RepID=A0A939SUL7_KLEPN|nr:hypothetical protein [Klebsiella pneumoniae]
MGVFAKRSAESTPDPASAAPPGGHLWCHSAFVPDGATLIRPTGASRSSYTPGPSARRRTPPAPYLPLCRMAASPYPAYGILP